MPPDKSCHETIFLSLLCRAITFTAGQVLKEAQKPFLVGDRHIGGHFKKHFGRGQLQFKNCEETVVSFIGRPPKGAYSSRGRSRHLLEIAFSEPLLRTLLRTLFYYKTQSRPPSQNPSENPFPRTLPRTFSEPFLERCVAVRPVRRAPNFSHETLGCLAGTSGKLMRTFSLIRADKGFS